MSIQLPRILASLLLLVGACSERGDGTSDGGSTGGTGTDAGAPSTSDAPGSTGGDLPTTTDELTTDGYTTGEFTTADEPTTGEPAEPPAACAAYCDKQVECELFAGVDDCLDFCSDEYTRHFPACQDATATFLECMTGKTCDELLFADPEAGACPAEQAPMDDLCNDEYGFCGVSVSSGGGECDLAIECDGEPLLEMKCDDTTCTCLSGGVEIGTCAAEAICDHHDAVLEKSEPCCGF